MPFTHVHSLLSLPFPIEAGLFDDEHLDFKHAQTFVKDHPNSWSYQEKPIPFQAPIQEIFYQMLTDYQQ
ncbi:MAG: hypothetical protein D6B25_12965 [Desulfobulbaceae bacterium]|nr:MAG: hypothetical protein D6B25_12965 [Desulfobulbaceae bacterium]